MRSMECNCNCKTHPPRSNGARLFQHTEPGTRPFSHDLRLQTCQFIELQKILRPSTVCDLFRNTLDKHLEKAGHDRGSHVTLSKKPLSPHQFCDTIPYDYVTKTCKKAPFSSFSLSQILLRTECSLRRAESCISS